MGTSLKVHPFCGLIEYVDNHVPRLLINREKVGMVSHNTPWYLNSQIFCVYQGHELNDYLLLHNALVCYRKKGFDFDMSTNTLYRRDAYYKGDCDTGCLKLAELLGWEVSKADHYPMLLVFSEDNHSDEFLSTL